MFSGRLRVRKWLKPCVSVSGSPLDGVSGKEVALWVVIEVDDRTPGAKKAWSHSLMTRLDCASYWHYIGNTLARSRIPNLLHTVGIP